MALSQDAKREERAKHIRGTGRIKSRVPVAIEWSDAGRSVRAEGYTVDISPRGCLVVIPRNFPVGDTLRLINLINQIGCEAILVWRGHEGPAGWELGLELRDPSPDFWGLDF